MGCWVSKNKSSKAPLISNNNNDTNSKSPPPTHPLPEEQEQEETVKEVLSESIPKSVSPFIRTAPLLSKPAHRKKHQNDAVFMAFPPDDFSEIGSTVSEGISVSTTVTENRENDERSPARFKNRSFSGEVKREKSTVGKSPGRRSEPSPDRVRPGYGRRRENGESSGRRSRSPVTRTDTGVLKPGLGRSLSSRKTGKSPSRVGSGLGERIRKLDDGGDKKWAPTSNELLENPLVSLECFIFL